MPKSGGYRQSTLRSMSDASAPEAGKHRKVTAQDKWTDTVGCHEETVGHAERPSIPFIPPPRSTYNRSRFSRLEPSRTQRSGSPPIYDRNHRSTHHRVVVPSSSWSQNRILCRRHLVRAKRHRLRETLLRTHELNDTLCVIVQLLSCRNVHFVIKAWY